MKRSEGLNKRLHLINEAIKKQLESAGKNLQDMVPDANKLIELINKTRKKHGR